MGCFKPLMDEDWIRKCAKFGYELLQIAQRRFKLRNIGYPRKLLMTRQIIQQIRRGHYVFLNRFHNTAPCT